MNNEWNDEVVVDVSESDITVDQAYDATSSNPQSGTAVAQAVAQAGGTVDQRFNAESRNAQSGTAVTEAIYLNRPLTTTQASQTEIDVDVKGDAPIKLIAEDYGSVSGPSVAATFKVAHMKTSGGPTGVEIVFDLPTPQVIPVNVQFVVNSDITGSNPNYAFRGDGYFGAAESDTMITSPVYPSDLRGVGIIGNSSHTILAGSYNLSLTTGNPSYAVSQVSVVFDGAGDNNAWTDLCDYIIANASTLFSLSIPSTVKTARLLPASTSSDADKVLTVNASGKPAWATAASGGATWTTTQYTTGATVNQGSIIIPLDDPLPVKAGPNLFAVYFRAQLKNGVSDGNYSIRVKVGTNAYTDAIVYMTGNSTDVYGKVVIAGVWSSVPSTLPQTLSLFPNGAAGGGFVATGTVSATVSLLN